MGAHPPPGSQFYPTKTFKIQLNWKLRTTCRVGGYKDPHHNKTAKRDLRRCYALVFEWIIPWICVLTNNVAVLSFFVGALGSASEFLSFCLLFVLSINWTTYKMMNCQATWVCANRFLYLFLLLWAVPCLVLALIKGKDVSLGNLVATNSYSMMALYNLDNVRIPY